MKEEQLINFVNQGAFFKTVVEDGSDIVFVVDYQGTILYHNDSVQELLGHSKDRLIGMSFFSFIDADSREDFVHDFTGSTKTSFKEGVEFRFLCADNSYKFLEYNSINLSHKEGLEGLILDCRDISQRKRDAAELLRAQKAKEQFLANMSHEIRTPINGIAGMVNLLTETTSEQDRTRYLEAIRNSTENLKVIINDILDFSVIESGKLKLEKIGFNIRYQLGAVVDSFVIEARNKDIDIQFEIDEAVNGVYKGDPVRLNQIMINLVGNSLKFTHNGSIKITAQLHKKQGKEHYVRFLVTDSGVGIPQEKLNRIFESFTQADETVTRRYGGTGLGLSIVKQLVELQKGEISVTSRVDVGTTFDLVIPYEAGNITDLVAPYTQSRPSHDFSLSGVRVLLVEDNDINRLYALNMLRKWECTVECAENGLIACEKIKFNSYDIVLMDVQMPIMDGYEATRKIRMIHSSKDLPIIALTANAIKGDNMKCLEAGMNDYLPKPFQPEDLFKVIRKFVPQYQENDVTNTKEAQPSTINLDHLREISNNDENFISDMIQTFLQNTPAQLQDLADARKGATWNIAAKLVHKMKPSVTFMGISGLKDIIPKLLDHEKYAHELPQLCKQFETVMAVACEELHHMIEVEEI